MIKYFYFGVIPASDLANYGEDFGPFMSDGVACEYRIELDLVNGHMRIEDCLGRMVPFDRDHYSALLGAVSAAEELQFVAEEIEEDLIALNILPDFVFHN